MINLTKKVLDEKLLELTDVDNKFYEITKLVLSDFSLMLRSIL